MRFASSRAFKDAFNTSSKHVCSLVKPFASPSELKSAGRPGFAKHRRQIRNSSHSFGAAFEPLPASERPNMGMMKQNHRVP